MTQPTNQNSTQESKSSSKPTIQIFENEALLIPAGEVEKIDSIYTERLRTCIFIRANYINGDMGFIHLDVFTTEEAIKKFVSDAKEIDIVYKAQKESNTKDHSQSKSNKEKWDKMVALIEKIEKRFRGDESFIGNEIYANIYNIYSVLRHVPDSVKVNFLRCKPVNYSSEDFVNYSYPVCKDSVFEEIETRGERRSDIKIIKMKTGVYDNKWKEKATSSPHIRWCPPGQIVFRIWKARKTRCVAK